MEEDQEICRVCRSESTPDHPLYHPCKCSGSIRFVHDDCLIEWLSHSKKKYCELCEHPFTFSPIYREDMPDRVPLSILTKQFCQRFSSLLKLSFRALCVLIVWLIVLPNFTLWSWRFYFWSAENTSLFFFQSATNTTSEEISAIAQANEETGSTTAHYLHILLNNSIEGLVITIVVVFNFIAAYLFREWVRQNLPAAGEQQQPPAPIQPIIEPNNVVDGGQNQAELQQAALDALLNVMQVYNEAHDNIDNPPDYNQLRNQIETIRADLDHALATYEDTPEGSSSSNQRILDHNITESSGRHHDEDSDQEEHVYQHRNWDYDTIELEEEIERELDGMNDDEEEEEGNEDSARPINWEDLNRAEMEFLQNRFNAARVAAPPPPPPPEPIAPAAAEDDEDVIVIGDDLNGILEAIGLRGNPWRLLQSSGLMILLINVCLGIAVWIPYIIGRLVILIRPIAFIETPIYFMRLITDPIVDFILDRCIPFVWSQVRDLVPVGLKALFEHTVQESAPTNTVGLEEFSKFQGHFERLCKEALVRWHGFATGRTAMDRTVCIFVGYLVLIGVGSWIVNYKRPTHPRRHPRTGELIRDLILRQGIFLKVLFFIIIELVLFPAACGFLLDLATLPLFEDASITSRLAFHSNHPYLSCVIHWVMGTGVLFNFANFIATCRKIVRPGVMWFVRDPNDPQFHPVQEMVERPLFELLFKISQSALIYAGMLVFGVGTVTYGLGFTGLIFPLGFSDRFWRLCMDLLIARFVLPPLLKELNPKEVGKTAFRHWWEMASRHLRLTSFMFNQNRPEEEGRHVRRTWTAFFLRKKAEINEDLELDTDQDVVFVRDGMMLRVPMYDSVPVDPKRRMLVPVDPITHQAIDEEERLRGHPAAADTMDESLSTIVVYVPPYFKQRLYVFLVYMWFFISVLCCSFTVLPLLFGRKIFTFLVGTKVPMNDVFAFILGIYGSATIGYIIHWINTYSKMTEGSKEYLQNKLNKIGRVLYIGFVLALVTPTVLSILTDLYILAPFNYNIERDIDLVSYLSKNWLYGVGYMSIIYDIIQFLPENNRLQQRLNELTRQEVLQLDLTSLNHSIVYPTLLSSIAIVNLPKAMSYLVLQFFDNNLDELSVIRYSYPVLSGLALLLAVCYMLKKMITIWIRTVRDDTYLIGKRLHNMQTTSDVNPASS